MGKEESGRKKGQRVRGKPGIACRHDSDLGFCSKCDEKPLEGLVGRGNLKHI